MSDQLTVDGKEYVSSKRASELSGYTQDYIGQLARSGQIDAQRIGGLWHISMPSLSSYKERAEQYKPEPPKGIPQQDPDSVVSFDGKDYVSAARAAKITGYHQDYVGQLARSGKVLSRQIGNRWYVEREGLQTHKEEKDALLAAVQAEAVGLKTTGALSEEEVVAQEFDQEPPLFTYTRESGDLLPVVADQSEVESIPETSDFDEEYQIPIRVNRAANSISHSAVRIAPKLIPGAAKASGKTMFYATLTASALTVVVVLSFGFWSLKSNSVYTVNIQNGVQYISRSASTASVGAAFDQAADFLERVLVPELTFKRTDQ